MAMDPKRLGLISKRLQYFHAVTQAGSIRRAALALDVAPSVISRTIRQLEADLKRPLFTRVRQRLHLTSAGEILVYYNRASLHELTQACAYMDDLQGLRRGTVSIVSVESVARGILPSVFSELWTSFPNVEIRLHTAGSQEACDAVANGDCDLAIAFDTNLPRTARRLASASVYIGALVHPNHPLTGRSEVRLNDFVGERILIAGKHLALGFEIADALRELENETSPRMVTNSIDMLIECTRHGHGVTFQTPVGAERELANGDLNFIPLREFKRKPRKLLLVTRSGQQMPEAPTALANLITKAMKRLEQLSVPIQQAQRQTKQISPRNARA
jgi:DNA-binding transcriptional LysR family regulator